MVLSVWLRSGARCSEHLKLGTSPRLGTAADLLAALTAAQAATATSTEAATATSTEAAAATAAEASATTAAEASATTTTKASAGAALLVALVNAEKRNRARGVKIEVREVAEKGVDIAGIAERKDRSARVEGGQYSRA